MTRLVGIRAIIVMLAGMTLSQSGVSQFKDAVVSGARSGVGSALGVQLASMSGVLDGIIEKAGNEANYVVFNMATQLRMQVEAFRLSARDVIDHGADRLDNTRAQVFRGLESSIIALEAALDQPIENARQALEEVHQIVNDAVPWLRETAIHRSYPAVLAPLDLKVITFTFRGLNLDSADPQLTLGDKAATRIKLEQRSAAFTLPATAFPRDLEEPKIVTGKIRLSVKECRLLVLCESVSREHEVAVLVLPLQLAKISITHSTKSEQRVYTDRKFSRVFSYSTGDLTRMKCKKENQGSHDPAYFIDLDTLTSAPYKVPCPFPDRGFLVSLARSLCKDGQLEKAGVTGRARYSWDVVTKNPAGYTVELCAQSQIHNFSKRSGEVFVNLTWREYKKANVASPPVIPPGIPTTLTWQSPLDRLLPDDTHALTVRLEYFDGSRVTFDGDYSDKFVKATWNNATKQLIVQPLRPKSMADLSYLN